MKRVDHKQLPARSLRSRIHGTTSAERVVCHFVATVNRMRAGRQPIQSHANGTIRHHWSELRTSLNPTLLNSGNQIRRDGFLIGNRLAQIPQSRKHRDSRFIEHLLVTDLWSGGAAPSIHHAQSGTLELDA